MQKQNANNRFVDKQLKKEERKGGKKKTKRKKEATVFESISSWFTFRKNIQQTLKQKINP